MITEFLSQYEIAERIAKNFKELRLRKNLTQMALSRKSGVSLGSLKRFENDYEISLKNMIKLAISMDTVDGFLNIFEKESPQSIDDILKEKKMNYKTRKRASGND